MDGRSDYLKQTWNRGHFTSSHSTYCIMITTTAHLFSHDIEIMRLFKATGSFPSYLVLNSHKVGWLCEKQLKKKKIKINISFIPLYSLSFQWAGSGSGFHSSIEQIRLVCFLFFKNDVISLSWREQLWLPVTILDGNKHLHNSFWWFSS